MMSIPRISLDFTAPPPIPAEGVERVNELMATGHLFRYGEFGESEQDVAALEREFAASVGARYAVAFNSCGAALTAAIAAVGVKAGAAVAMNAFTLAPVPGAISRLGARPVFVEITSDLVVDLDDLAAKLDAASAVRVLLLSHMRGHIGDLDAVAELCARNGVTLIEDCAHTMGASWRERPTGRFGAVGCFSTQTFKHINSGEGGLLVTDDDDIAARAILYSGSYMLYRQHGTVPPEAVMARHSATVPNCSSRMTAWAAAVLRPQLRLLDERADHWNTRYHQIEAGLCAAGFELPRRPEHEHYVASSIQFDPGLGSESTRRFVDLANGRGVSVKWFGRQEPVGFTSRYDHWRYVDEQSLPATARVLQSLCDMRIPLTMTTADADLVVEILSACRAQVAGVSRGAGSGLSLG